MVVLATPGLERRLNREISGEILFDNFSRGRYATDASIYQMMPVGVVVPKTEQDIEMAITAAREEGIAILARGGGTSQCGQTVNQALVIDNSKYFNQLLELDVENRRCVVQPGMVLDELNRALRSHGLWFPVDVSTASRATIGGMAGNNSCGGRSLRYGLMRDNVLSIDAILADGTRAHFGQAHEHTPIANLLDNLLSLGDREAAEIARRFPDILRRVGGYNIDALVPAAAPNNFAHLLVGSEGTLAYSTSIELKLSPLVSNKVMGVCHFSSFYAAMDATQHLVALNPQAVELVDSTMIALARNIPLFRNTVEGFVKGEPEALLLVEFGEEDVDKNLRKLDQLEETMHSLGFFWNRSGKFAGGVIKITDNQMQREIAEVRKSGLNIMMSMKDAGKPVSFVEDCAVNLPDLAEYTAGLTEIFKKHNTNGTWYAHASVGCLHVRPILNMKLDKDVSAMREIAEEAFALVRQYKGSHSGEHGDGIVRSEFHLPMFGERMVSAFEEVKNQFDPDGLFNPGKIVNPPKMDDQSLFRYHRDYCSKEFETKLDWSPWPGSGGGLQGAVEMCNNNGACRKMKSGTMCPSFRVTGNERDVTRGRANSLRLAISGQFGDGALSSDEMMETMKLCVSCKGCKRECPTGVDMAAMKIEVLAARAKEKGISLGDRLVAYLPRYAPTAARIAPLMNQRNRHPFLARALELPTGLSAKRILPAWQTNPFKDSEIPPVNEPQAILFADTFNRYFHPDNLRAASRVLQAGGIAVEVARPKSGRRPLCCGRTFLSAGLVEEARTEAKRLVNALIPHAENGLPIIGLEPSCLLTLRDEIPRMLPGQQTSLLAEQAKMLEEFIAEQSDAGALNLTFNSPSSKILIHGHCHQKAMGVMSSIEKTLSLLPDTQVEVIESSCCGMAGTFGYGVDTQEISLAMGELDLFPAIRNTGQDTIIIADGISCRHQILDGTQKQSMHIAKVLEMALERP